MANENVPPQENHETLKVSTSSDPHHSPKILLIGLAAFLIIIIGAGIGYFLGVNNQSMTDQTPSPTPLPTKAPAKVGVDETANWKTFIDTKGIFTLKYPDTWYTNDCVTPQFDIKPFNDCGSSRSYPIYVQNYDNKTVDQVIEQEKEYYNVTEKNIKISETDYKQFEVSLREDAPAAPYSYRKATITFFPLDNQTYALVYVKSENLDYLNIYNQVLLTFKFTDQKNQTVCTQDAKLCPDGSYVGRTGPNCEFTLCP